ncbi:MAG TPA: SCO family protein [Thermomicrobiales bacterium]|nr:SCO family protein [Thermomicrobiales bacterium]
MFKSRQKNIIFGAGTVVLVLIVALGAWLAFFRSDSAYAYKGGFYEPPNAASPLNLVDQNNKPFTLDQVKGKVTLLYFGYTYCPDFCPTTLTDFGKVKKELGTQASDVDVVFVTVDPDRDTPARMKQYLAFFDPTFIGLYGKQDQLTPIEQAYGIQVVKDAATPGTDYYSVSHSTSLYAIDQQGNLRLTWPYGTTPEDITSDVKHLLSSGS